MDIQQIVGDFMKSAADDPNVLQQFGVDPGEALKNAVGIDLNDEQLKDAMDAITPLLSGDGLDMNKVMEVAGDFLGDGDVLGKLGDLFGGGSKE